jgi:hypothetical protein
MKSLAVSSLVMVFLQGTKCAIFITESTITNIASKFFEDGNSMAKSMETEDQGCLGIGSGYENPYIQCQGFFDLEQVSQNNTNSLMAFHIWGHQKSREMNPKCFVEPKMSNGWKNMTSLQDLEACGSFRNIQALFKVKKVVHKLEFLTIVIRATLDIKNYRVHGGCCTNLIKK